MIHSYGQNILKGKSQTVLVYSQLWTEYIEGLVSGYTGLIHSYGQNIMKGKSQTILV